MIGFPIMCREILEVVNKDEIFLKGHIYLATEGNDSSYLNLISRQHTPYKLTKDIFNRHFDVLFISNIK